ncbi:MAG: FlgD immunoglobulin-like domain containing protein [candidate division KSB1 bacterium]|nr:FlgD immunoglobulin-like domain containing protein [candidate division KSB1 bacterium]
MKVKWLFLCLGILWLPGMASADFPRMYDVIMLTGDDFPRFLQQPLEEIKAWSYSSATDTWSAATLQIDQLDDGTSYFSSKNGLLDPADEVLIAAQELGDQADITGWPQAGVTQRHELAVTDPHSGSVGYLYFFQTLDLAASEEQWVSVRNDTVYGRTYTMAHDSLLASGLPAMLKIGESNVDFMDKWRFQLKITKIEATFEGIPINLSQDFYVTESIDKSYTIKQSGITIGSIHIKAFQDGSPQLISGPLRVTRKIRITVEFSGLMESEAQLPLTIQYYPYNTEFAPDFSLEFPDIDKLKGPYLEFSKAFNDAALQMRFHGYHYDLKFTDETDDHIINDNNLDIFDHEINEAEWDNPDSLWYGFSGHSSSLVDQVSSLHMFFPAKEYLKYDDGRSPVLFYFDKKVNGDYGYEDYQVFGVNGLRIQDWEVEKNDSLNLGGRFLDYYFPENKTTGELESLYEQQRLALQSVVTFQEYDRIPPAFVQDLNVNSVTDTSAVLEWTAPGDDGQSGGPVSRYEICVNDQAPTASQMGPNEMDYYWYTLADKLSYTGSAGAGETELFEAPGLQSGVTFYFRIRAVDDDNNWSGISNTAWQATTPVELAALSARVTDARVVLSWSTQSETNNLGFAVQRRKFGQTDSDWQTLRFVNGRGTTSKTVHYEFIDKVTTGHYEYRLKQTDTDGAFSYSSILRVEVSAPKAFALQQNYPNPFNPETVIRYELPARVTGPVTLVIHDMLGRMIKVVREPAQAGYHRFVWDGTDASGTQVSSGVYLYTLKAGSFVKTCKMVKLQ